MSHRGGTGRWILFLSHHITLHCFVELFFLLISEADKTAASTSAGPSLNNMAGTESKNLPSFWIPSLTPAAAPTQVKKPVSVLCVAVFFYSKKFLSEAPLLLVLPS